jgi:SRSO17 transposase
MMDRLPCDESETRFSEYIEQLVGVIGHADRASPLRDYCRGLLVPGERKSVEPMAAVTAPARVAAQHQSLLHFVGNAPWSDERVLAKVRELVLPSIEREGPIEAWIIDDTGFPKKGTHSVGVARQYCGQLGKQDNCQVAVSLSLANAQASLPVAYRLYLPEAWASDEARRKKAGVPKEIGFQSKIEIALDQIRAACAAGLPRGVVLMDAGYGNHSELRAAVTALDLSYVAGILSNTTVWAPGTGPLPPKPYVPGRGRPTKQLRRDDEHQPAKVKDLAFSLPPEAWQIVTWREGTNVPLTSRFARLRIRAAHRDFNRSEPWPEEWLLVEWPEAEKEPTKYWLSSLPDTIGFARLVELAKLRWRIERDYQELKQEVGLGHYEGRGWRGFHHHATICIAAYGFLISEQGTIPPSGPSAAQTIQKPPLPQSYRPRGAADPARAPHPELDCQSQTAPNSCTRQNPRPMSMLSRTEKTDTHSTPLMTQ